MTKLSEKIAFLEEREKDEDKAIEACFMAIKPAQMEAVRKECDALIEQLIKIREAK